jgi:RNA polymerase sigma-70 factor (ECF subfamily)
MRGPRPAGRYPIGSGEPFSARRIINFRLPGVHAYVMDEPLRLVPELVAEAPATATRNLSFDDLVEAEHAGLYGALCLITRDRPEAQDIMQEAFLKVWERWDRIKGMDDPAGYLYRTALNLYRKRTRRAALAIRRAVGLGPRPDELGEVEARDAVVRALAALTPRQRASVVLVELLDYTSEEAARVMGIKAATVRVLASQGRAALKRNAGERDE